MERVGNGMILVDLEVPSMRKSYQFSLEENCSVELLIAEIVEMICQKEHCQLIDNWENLELCSKNRKRILDRQKTLTQQQIGTGDSLILL